MKAIGLALLFLGSALCEFLGVASLLPFMSLACNPNLVEHSENFRRLYELSGLTQPLHFVYLAGFAALAILTFSNFFSALSTWLSLVYASMLQHELCSSLIKRLMSRPYSWYLHQNTIHLAKTVVTEASQLSWGFVLPALRLLSRASVALLVLVGLIWVNSLVALAIAATLGTLYATVFALGKNKLSLITRSRLESDQRRSKAVHECLGAVKPLKVLTREAFSIQEFCRHSKDSSDLLCEHLSFAELPRYFLETLAFGCVILVVLALLSSHGSMTEIVPTVSVFTLGAYRMMPALQQVFSNLTIVRLNQPILDLIHTLYFPSPAVEEESLEPGHDHLDFHDMLRMNSISYTYPGNETSTLQNVTIDVKKNASVALVGTTGTGKTTTVDILLGLLEPDQGHIELDGVPLSSEDIRRWRRAIGYVPQDIYLVDDTVKANIAFSVPLSEINLEAVERAARIARIHDFIVSDLPHGYDTLVGERGVRLSGGQRQRIGIARALYHDPGFLVLDEATSALDGATETAVMEAVQELSGTKTMVVIAHRLATVKLCSCIYFLQEGRVCDQGTYEELIERNSSFRAMAAETERSSPPGNGRSASVREVNL